MTTTTPASDARWALSCGDRAEHVRHNWHNWGAGFCYGVTAEDAQRMRFRKEYREHWGPMTNIERDALHDSGEDEWRNE